MSDHGWSTYGNFVANEKLEVFSASRKEPCGPRRAADYHHDDVKGSAGFTLPRASVTVLRGKLDRN
jgi:hypothetical protein